MLDINKEVIKTRCNVLEQASKDLISETEISDQSLKTISKLPSILDALALNESLGSIILSKNGNVLLFNGAAQKIFSNVLLLDDLRKFTCKTYLEDRITLCPEDDLPWNKALQGIKAEGKRYFLPNKNDQGEGASVSIGAIPLSGIKNSPEMSGGAIVLAVDITESLQLETRIKAIVSSLSQHILTMEIAQREITALSEKLGLSTASNASIDLNSSSTIPIPNSDHSKTQSNELQSLFESDLQIKDTDRNLSKYKKPILIVDDLLVNQYLLQMLLEKEGFEVHTAINGEIAVQKIRLFDYALIFMDCDMPVMNGYEATITIRKEELHSSKHTPIVAMTAYDRAGDLERCKTVGMDGYLTKGASQEEIIEMINTYVTDFEAHSDNSHHEISQTAEAIKENDDDFNSWLTSLKSKYGPESLEEIIRLFLSSGANILGLLEEAIDKKDSQTINHLCFTFKGPCSSMGIQQMVKLTIDLAGYSVLGRWSHAKQLYLELFKHYKEIESISIQFINKKQEKNLLSKSNQIVTDLPADTDKTTKQVFDTLNKFKGKVGNSGVKQLLEAYELDLKGAEENIRKAIEDKDSNSLRALSHKLAGCLRSLGASDGELICKEMEELASRSSWQQAANKYVTMFTAIRHVTKILKHYGNSGI